MDFNQSVSQTFERSCTILLVLGFYFRSLLCAALHWPHHTFSVRASSCTPEGVWASGLGGGGRRFHCRAKYYICQLASSELPISPMCTSASDRLARVFCFFPRSFNWSMCSLGKNWRLCVLTKSVSVAVGCFLIRLSSSSVSASVTGSCLPSALPACTLHSFQRSLRS